MSESKIEKNLISFFHQTYNKNKTYRLFLKNSTFDPKEIKTFSDFFRIPAMDKKNYIHKYNQIGFFEKKGFPPIVYSSSGSSGKPTFWFRSREQENIGGLIHEKIVNEIFKIKKNESTLVIICFSMGVWVAGNFTAASFRELERRGYNLSIITPGIEREDIINILKYLAPHFRHVIITGYPPFIMDVAHDIVKKGIKLNNNLKLIVAGEKFSENWRDYLLKKMNIKNPFSSLVSVYGSADCGAMAYETPFSIFLRRKLLKNLSFKKELVGSVDNLPNIFQYNPGHIFFEEIDNELIVTANTAIPLIRYNIKDTGKIFSYNEIGSILKKFHFIREAAKYGLNEWKLPFIFLSGRTDVAVTFYALNIYPENIQVSLEDKKIAKYLSGNFFIYNKVNNKGKNQNLYLKLEMAKKVIPNAKIFNKIMRVVVDNLCTNNIEYRKLYSVLQKKALPIIKLYNFGSKNFYSKVNRGVIHFKGKKPKIIFK